MSAFEVYRRKFKPALPRAIQGASYHLHTEEKTHPVADEQDIAALFPKTTHLPLLDIQPDTGAPKLLEPKRVGVIFSGGQAPVVTMCSVVSMISCSRSPPSLFSSGSRTDQKAL